MAGSGPLCGPSGSEKAQRSGFSSLWGPSKHFYLVALFGGFLLFYLPLTNVPPGEACSLPAAVYGAADRGGFADFTATLWFPLATTSRFETRFIKPSLSSPD